MEFFRDLLIGYGVGENIASYFTYGIIILIIIIVSTLAYLITKKVILRLILHFIENNSVEWDRVLVERRVFHKLALIVPAIVIYLFAPVFKSYEVTIEKIVFTYVLIIIVQVISALLDCVDDIYNTFPISKTRPIKGLLQVVKIAAYIITAIIIIANLIGESPIILLSGIGALAAVFSFVFKDSILGLVAGIQLTTNDMLRIGDWIELPNYGVDGFVQEISLVTVRVKNFDNTIVSIPAYTLISDSFKNWRGMQDSGGRRIKRSIYIDTNSIDFCTDEMLEKFKKIEYIRDYIIERKKEIDEYNKGHNLESPVNGRRLTNIGVFRVYLMQYLKNHPKIHQGMTQMVRQLAPGENGLPIEIYAFTNDTNWINYEGIQADIFDHILAAAKEFGLRIFQHPSGSDIRYIKDG
ncbi:MAG: mechanosensitive ion channel [Clostridiales bacterium]|nr:mechanosensitive ion channel [Clostridiales bacterium]